MKRAFLLITLMLVVCACSSALAIQYGDYAYTIANGQATIVSCSGHEGGPDWDYLDEEEGKPERPGKWDESARFPHFIDGVWRMVIPDALEGYPVVAIGDEAFCEAGRFHDAIIPEGVVSIGDRAFSHCYALGALTIPASVTSIGEDLVINDFGYTVLRVTEGSYAARYAQENEIPYTYDAQFRFIESGEWLYTLADDTATIYGFRGSCDDDGNVTIPDHLDGHPVTAIEYGAWIYAFCRNGLTMTSVTIPQSVASIGDKVFSECTALSSVIFPEGVTSIGNYVFDECESLTGVAIPASCTSIGERAFENCPNLVLTVIEGGYAEQYAKENHIPYVFTGELTQTGYMPDAAGQWKYVLEDGNATIKGWAEEPEGDLAIPGELDGYPVAGIGDEVFGNCVGLTGVTFPDSVTYIGDKAFRGCFNLTVVTLPNSVTHIGDWTFYACFSLTDVTLPNSVTRIGDRAFSSCGSLTSVTLPETVTYIGDYAFSNCESLTGVTIPDSVTYIGDYAFCGCKSLSAVTVPNGVTRISDYVFADCEGLTSVTLPETVTFIGYGAFSGCERLTGVTLPDGVTFISDLAFSNCAGITAVTLPGSVTDIGDYAFTGCEGLTGAAIPDSVTRIGSNPFDGCPLSFIHVSAGNPAYEHIEGVLIDKEQKMLVSYPGGRKGAYVIPDGIARIGDSAFSFCRDLTGATIPDSVTAIGGWAFFGCAGITTVTLPGSVTAIGDYAFDDCENVILRVMEGSVAEAYAQENQIPYVHAGS